MQSSSDFSTWTQFFKNAQIQQQFVNVYATKFCDNRIRFDMLNDIDKPLLNEMGITAIGDCLSILKYAKQISVKMEEDKKEAMLKENPKKRGEVAKRIIENYLGDHEVKVEKPTSNLSQDLMSRLNFTKSPVVKFNEESLGKVVVSSTTDDIPDSKSKNLSLKRKLNDNSSDTESIDDGKPLEYRGLLKNTPDAETNKVLSLNEVLKMKKTQTKIIKLNKKKVTNTGDEDLGVRIQTSLESICKQSIETDKKIISLKKIKQSNGTEVKTDVVEKKTSVFSRIKPVQSSSPSTAAAAVRLLKEAVTIKKPEVTKIIPIKSDFKKEIKNDSTKVIRLNQPVKRLANTKSVHDRLSFNK